MSNFGKVVSQPLPNTVQKRKHDHLTSRDGDRHDRQTKKNKSKSSSKPKETDGRKANGEGTREKSNTSFDQHRDSKKSSISDKFPRTDSRQQQPAPSDAQLPPQQRVHEELLHQDARESHMNHSREHPREWTVTEMPNGHRSSGVDRRSELRNAASSIGDRASASITRPHRGVANLNDAENCNGTPSNLMTRTWSFSPPIAGRFIDDLPVLTKSEEYLICATELALHVYTTSDSLLKHALIDTHDVALTSFALSESREDIIYVASAGGNISQWDFKLGHKIATWDVGYPIHKLATTVERMPDGDVVYSICRGPRYMICAFHTTDHNDHLNPTPQVLLTTDGRLQSFRILDRGRLIVAITDKALIVGSRSRNTSLGEQGSTYHWREIQCSQPLVSFDAKLFGEISGKNQVRLNVAVAGLRGPIYVYQDLLSHLGPGNTGSGPVEDASAATSAAVELHWHREAARAIAWSSDGNYLISGGVETVMVLWQLDSGKKQFLPHLEAAVQSLSASPSGGSYVVGLADNSVLVLSASELTPTVHVAGLQTRSLPAFLQEQPELPTMELWTAINNVAETTPVVQAVIDPRRPAELLATVSATQRHSNIFPLVLPTPYLQTFDMQSSRHISRQALTRTTATHLNTGPEGNRITEPDVRFVKVSSSGLWMATVDEWSPNTNDLEDVASDMVDIKLVVDQQRTVQLRFWSRDEHEHRWILHSRFDTPHQLEGTRSAGKVLDLIARPGEEGFATLGQDSKIKLWAPTIRQTRDVTTNGESDAHSHGAPWALRKEISLDKRVLSEPFSKINPAAGKLAFSPDGSVLVAYQNFEQPMQHRDFPLFYFVNAEQGHIYQSRADLGTELDSVHSMGFLHHYLVLLSSDKCLLWDSATMEIHAQIDISPSESIHGRTVSPPLPLLAVDSTSSTIAISLPQPKAQDGHLPNKPLVSNALRTFSSKVELYDLHEISIGRSRAFWSATLPRLVLSLLSYDFPPPKTNMTPSDRNASKENGGYVLLDAGACIRRLTMETVVNQSDLPTDMSVPDEETEPQDTMSWPGEDTNSSINDMQAANGRVLDLNSSTSKVVPSQRLSDLFEYPAHAMPPLTQLFDGVLNLYASKSALIDSVSG